MTLFSKKVLISNRCISGLMPNLIKKSWTDSRLDPYQKLDSKRLSQIWLLWTFQERTFNIPILFSFRISLLNLLTRSNIRFRNYKSWIFTNFLKCGLFLTKNVGTRTVFSSVKKIMQIQIRNYGIGCRNRWIR